MADTKYRFLRGLVRSDKDNDDIESSNAVGYTTLTGYPDIFIRKYPIFLEKMIRMNQAHANLIVLTEWALSLYRYTIFSYVFNSKDKLKKLLKYRLVGTMITGVQDKYPRELVEKRIEYLDRVERGDDSVYDDYVRLNPRNVESPTVEECVRKFITKSAGRVTTYRGDESVYIGGAIVALDEVSISNN